MQTKTLQTRLDRIEDQIAFDVSDFVDRFLRDHPEFLDRVADTAADLAVLPRAEFLDQFDQDRLGLNDNGAIWIVFDEYLEASEKGSTNNEHTVYS